MPMPSLLKYFAFVGTALLAVITLANFLLDPSTGATAVATQAKVVPVVQHDPRASKVERWRNEQAALKAAAQTQTAENASLVTKSELAPPPAQAAAVTQPVQPAPARHRPSRVQAQPAEPALQTADVSAEHDAEAARAAELAREGRAGQGRQGGESRPQGEARARPRPGRSARARGRARPVATRPVAARAEPVLQRRAAALSLEPAGSILLRPARAGAAAGPGYAYAPRPNYGPFGGWGGRGW